MELKYQSKISKLKKVRISIETAYKWGEGWLPEDAIAFKEEVIYGLKLKGFKIKPADISGGCETIEGINGTYLYLHPMEFTGYLTDEDLKKVLDVLKKSKTVKAVLDVKTKEVEGISDYEYKEILINNAKEILEWIKQNPKADAFTFAEKYRIKRVGDGCGLSSSDVDVSFVDTLMKLSKVLAI